MPNLPPVTTVELPTQLQIPVRLLYSVQESADLLGVGKDYMYERINSGEIPTVQLGTDNRAKRRIAAEDLQAFIDSRKEVA